MYFVLKYPRQKKIALNKPFIIITMLFFESMNFELKVRSHTSRALLVNKHFKLFPILVLKSIYFAIKYSKKTYKLLLEYFIANLMLFLKVDSLLK